LRFGTVSAINRRWRGDSANEAGDRLRRFPDLLFGDVAAGASCICHTVAQVVFEEPDGNALQGAGQCGDLSEDVNSVLLVLDHAVDAA